MWGLTWRNLSFCPSPPCCPSQSTTGPPPSLTTLKSSSPFLTERVLRLKIKCNNTDCYSLFPVVPRRGSLLRVLGLPEPELERGGLRGGHRRLHPRQDRVQVGGRGRGTCPLCNVVTRCDHLTNFGALFDVNGSLGDWDAVQMEILNYLSIVLMSLSILASSATVVILQFSRWQLSHMKLHTDQFTPDCLQVPEL